MFGGAAGFYFLTQRDQTPGAQMSFNSNKKTVVVLGSGWGAMSLLSTLYTEELRVFTLVKIVFHPQALVPRMLRKCTTPSGSISDPRLRPKSLFGRIFRLPAE